MTDKYDEYIGRSFVVSGHDIRDMLATSPVAKQYFQDAAAGRFNDGKQHDLYYGCATRQILTATYALPENYDYRDLSRQPICSINAQSIADYQQKTGAAPDFSKQQHCEQFVSHQLRDYEAKFYDQALQQGHDRGPTLGR